MDSHKTGEEFGTLVILLFKYVNEYVTYNIFPRAV